MLKFYVLKRGTEFKIASLDAQGALHWHEKGWELGNRPYESRQEADQAMVEWKDRSRRSEGT